MKRFFSKIPKSTKALLLILVIWIISAQKTQSMIYALDPSDNGNIASNNLGANLLINFDMETMWNNGASGNITLAFENGTGNWSTIETYGVNSGNLSGKDTSTLSINPTNDLITNRCYRVTVATCSVINPNSSLPLNYTCNEKDYLVISGESWSFTTGSGSCGGDTTAPTVSSFSPADNSTNVAIDANLIINFSENVDTQTGNLVIKKSSDNSTFQTISITSATGNGTSSLTFNPNDFANNTSYYVQIDATAVDDLFGNSYAGISDTTTWNFTTEPVIAWMDHNWLKRVKFTIDDSKVNGSVTDFPVYLKLSDFSSTNLFNNTRSDGADIRITQGDGLSVLASELVQYNAVANLGELHFKAPHLSNTANMDFYMYFDNSNARPINASDPLGKHDVWSNGFVAVYHMQENPNGDPSNSIYNSARNKYYGKPYGSMTSADRVAGQMGNGTDFDGMDDYYETDDISEIDNATKLTYSMWFKRRNSGSKILIDKSTSSSMTEMAGIHVWNSGNVHLQWRKGDQNEATYSSNDTSWHHVMSVFNGSGISSVTKIIGFHDGANQNLSYSGTLPTKLPINSSRFLIGKRHYDASFSDGYMDEIRIASKIRSAQWAKTEFNNQNSPSTFYTVSATVGTNSGYTRPKISSLYPRNQATQIPRKANLKIVFDGTITANTGNITIKQVSDNSTFATIAIGSGNVSISGSTLTIDPSSDLAANTEYYVLMDTDILRGTCGTSACGFSGISLPRGWRFKTTGSHIKEVIFHGIGF